jgi:amino acid adenylation domain-containing protein
MQKADPASGAANDSAARIKAASTLHEAFERTALLRGEATAVNDGPQRLSYRALNERANQLARLLQSAGAGPETPIALYLDRSIDMVVAILGVLKSGGFYVPIDLAYPRDRLAFMIDDAQAPIVLTQQNLAASLPAHQAKVICLDADAEKISSQPATTPPASVGKDSAAYMIYTSGSTGKPKGVVVTHFNVLRLLSQTAHWYGFNEGDVWPLFHSYAFDVSVWELWGSLLNGGRLVIVPYLVSRSPSDFYQLLAREKVTVLNQTPSAFRQLIWAEETAEKKLDLDIRYVVCAGEALELQSLKPWFARHGDQRPTVVNMYGITETTVHSTYRPIRQADLESGVGSVIGVPIPDLQIYLVDENLKPVPRGTVGEICVGGDGVARGYRNRDELNKMRFLADPFSTTPGARMYRSGDLAQYSETGELEYLGRIDHQVKIRGFRVELGEIESALNRHPGVRESVVIASDGELGDKRLVAYVVPVGEAPTITELRDHLKPSLPDYMVPAFFVFLSKLPLTNNGKVDRRALPAPSGERPELEKGFVAPRTEAEKTLARIWSEVLGIAKVGVNDNFFELGGDSIRSISVLSRAEQCGLKLSLEQMFQHPTIAEAATLATPAGQQRELARPTPFSLISPADKAKLPEDVEDAYPIARLQLGMYFHNELNPASAVYHDVFSFRVQSKFDREKLTGALERLLQRHAILRTSFHIEGFKEPLQMVHRRAPVHLTVEDFRQLSAQQQEAKIAEWVDKEKRTPFDRTVAPLVRFHAQLQSENAFQFIVSFHHSCLDGWSLAAVLTEIFEDYAAALRGENRDIAAPRACYRDFIALEQQTIASPETRHFWTETLEGANLQLMPRWPESMRPGGNEQHRGPEIFLDAKVVDGIKRLAAAAGVPLKTVLLAAHQRVMSLMYGQSDVTSGLLCNGRPEIVDGEKVIGLFLNTVPVRMRLEGGRWIDLVKQAFAAERALAPHRRFPVSEIQKLAGGRRVFEAAFDFVHFHVYNDLQGSDGLDLKEGHYFEANDLTSFTTFMLDASGSRMEMHIDFDPNAMCRAQIEELSGYYISTLSAMTADFNARYEDFSPLSDKEKERSIVQWNATAEDYPRTQCLHQLFAARAAAKPDAVAVECDGEKATYGELNRRADEIAQALAKLAVAPNTLVGICLERSVNMIAGLLGILKAGGAYVPLDPSYPQERLAFMLEDSKAKVLLTETALQGLLPKTNAAILMIDKPLETAAASSASAPKSALSSDLAYVIYTSGSTGKPKGVAVTHRSVVNLLASARKTIRFSEADRLLGVTTLSFDIAGLEIFLPLITGGTVVLASREAAADATKLGALIESSGATVMQATPATWRLLMESDWRGAKNLRVICGGEALSRALADELLARVGEVWNFYGPTETTIWSTCWKVVPGAPISIGRPVANTQLYILDSNNHPVPVGVAGELHIGGDGVAQGYVGRPDLTEAKFMRNPFTNDSEARLYKTGDSARYLPDGTVECLGRLDQQVKIRGFRVELGEIEAALRGHSGVADALVVARDDGSGEKKLIGYLVARNGPPPLSELRELVRAKLPHYMVPAHFVVLEEFPKTPNGKIDAKRLPAPESMSVKPRDYVAPRDEQERGLAEIWQQVLTLDKVSVKDDFFELGADSLSATRAFARINRRFAINLALRAIFENPTVEKLAAVVRNSAPQAAVRPSITKRRSRVSAVAESR